MAWLAVGSGREHRPRLTGATFAHIAARTRAHCGKLDLRTTEGKPLRRTKIVATVGPASWSPAGLKQLIDAGMDVARIGLAHGQLEDHLATYERVRAAAAESDRPIGVLVDLPGPKVRCAKFPEGGVEVEAGGRIRVEAGTTSSSAEVIEVDFPGVVRDMQLGDRLAFGDGNIVSTVVDKTGDGLVIELERGGVLQGRPGLQVPSARIDLVAPTQEDLRLADAFVEVGVDMVAVSFVRSAHDIRCMGFEPSPRGPLLVAKIETKAAVDNLDGIIEASGAVMVARGDLGTDFSLSELPHLQKHIIARCIAEGRPVITATQMLESMVHSPAPTRAEASDVANAVFDGSSAVMLSGESAIGIDPTNAVASMAEITERADDAFDHVGWARIIGGLHANDPDPDPASITTDAITNAATRVAEKVKAKAILCLSRTGFTVRSVTRFRPNAAILAFSPDDRSVSQLALSWGTEALLSPYRERASEMVQDALELAKGHSGLRTGDKVVVISGRSTQTRATDTLRVMEIP